MKLSKVFLVTLLFCAALAGSRATEQQHKIGDNAALRYYAAFTVMQDSAISDDEAQKLNRILEGTAPYDDVQYSRLVEKNTTALHLLQLGASHSDCDWGLEYQLGEQTPVEYARSALRLGRLNVLYAFHLSITGNPGEAVKTLSSGMRYSRHVASGGSLFATLVAKQLLAEHLRAIEGLNHLTHLSEPQKSLLRNQIEETRVHPLDWEAAITREFQALSKSTNDAALATISSKYAVALKSRATLPELEALIAGSPGQVRELIPSPRGVLEQKDQLERELQKAKLALQ